MSIDMKLEVVTLPVSTSIVQRASTRALDGGWMPISTSGRHPRGPVHSAALERLDRLRQRPDDRGAGSAQRFELVVSEIEAARDDLISRGVEVSELFHFGDGQFLLGPDPERRSYLTYASFSDPDGNGWLLQEVTNRRVMTRP